MFLGFIPFECIERFKIYYKIFKKQKIKSLQEKEIENNNENLKNDFNQTIHRPLFDIPWNVIIPLNLFGVIFCILKRNSPKNN
jgi:hypothetical protein